MSKEYSVETTLTIAGDETNVTVRAHVEYGPTAHYAMGAEIDGTIEAFVGGEWVALHDLDLDKGDEARAAEVLEDECLEDDAGLDADDIDRCCA